PVIPVLLEDARMPTAAELPPELARLARINALDISDKRWEYDVGRLVMTLEDIGNPAAPLGADPPPPEAPAHAPAQAPVPALASTPSAPTPRLSRRTKIAAIGAVVVLAAGIAAFLLAGGQSGPAG